MPDEELDFSKNFKKSSSTESSDPQQRGVNNSKRHRPVLQRQQRQSSEETETSLRGNVHFKEAPEYFEVAQKNAAGTSRTAYDLVKNVVSEKQQTLSTQQSANLLKNGPIHGTVEYSVIIDS